MHAGTNAPTIELYFQNKKRFDVLNVESDILNDITMHTGYERLKLYAVHCRSRAVKSSLTGFILAPHIVVINFFL